MDASAFGGFVISKNVLAGVPVRYTYREKSENPSLNGWHILSAQDDDEYIKNPSNFEIVSSETILPFCSVLFTFFNSPYGTDLFWKYDTAGNLIGFYDLQKKCDVTVEELARDAKNGVGEATPKAKSEILPLGSVVLLEGGIQKLLIIARALNVKNGNKELFFDYGAVAYPEGLIGDQMAYFNQENISKVVFEGYHDDDDAVFSQRIRDYLASHSDIQKGSASDWNAG